MHILIATDGTLDIEKTAEHVARLYEPGDEVTVFTAVYFPRTFMQSFAEVSGADEVAQIARAAGAAPLNIASGARAAERMASRGESRPVDPQQVGKTRNYLEVTAERRCRPLADALAARGVEASVEHAASDNQTARTILKEVERRNVDLVMCGTKGEGLFEGAIGSTATKIMRRSPTSVFIIR